MNKLKTYIFLLFPLFLLTWTSCEKLEIPEKEHTSQQEKKEEQANQEEEKEQTKPQEKPSSPNDGTPTDDPSDTNLSFQLLTMEDTINYVNNMGYSEDTSYSVYDLRNILPTYLKSPVWGKLNGMPNCYVCGYIVGHIPQYRRSIDKTIFNIGDVRTNVVIADSPTETNYQNCIAVQLGADTPNRREIREGINLADHPENIGRFAIFQGYVTTYMGVLGVKNLENVIIYTGETE